GEPIGIVDDWRARVESADVALVAAPEYAGGVAGALKNAFDWLGGSGSMYRKAGAGLSAGTAGGGHAGRQMAETRKWAGADGGGALGIAAPRTKSDADGRLDDPATLAAIGELTRSLLAAAAVTGDELVARATRVATLLSIDPVHIVPGAER